MFVQDQEKPLIKEPLEKIQLPHLIIPFALLGVGCTAGAVVFMCEICLAGCKYGYYAPAFLPHLYCADLRRVGRQELPTLQQNEETQQTVESVQEKENEWFDEEADEIQLDY
jgi:hypothetical protein